LRREAKQRSVNPERIVFARRVALNQDHLARHRLADLFLDTMPLGAHSIVCDALWAGTPVLTCAGATFGGRVAASVLSALGLAEFITHDVSSYKNRALQLARDRNTLKALREKLPLTEPYFQFSIHGGLRVILMLPTFPCGAVSKRRGTGSAITLAQTRNSSGLQLRFAKRASNLITPRAGQR
jgi:hypothetical protein